MSLVRPIQPMHDESLAGLVARAAAVNGYTHAHHILEQLDKKRWRPEAIALQPLEIATELARVLGTDDAKLRLLFHPTLLDTAFIDFFGTPLRAVYREPRLRRVSPRALKNSPYIRAVWSVRPLSFDPGTREKLIDSCPVCDKTLGFTQTWGVEFCEYCVGVDEWGLPTSTVDLRDFPQPLVETSDDEALDYVVSLVDPAGADRRSRHRLHESLENLPRGDLFQLARSLSAAVASLGTAERSYYIERKETRRPVDPELLARAGRILLEWPKSLGPLCEEARQNLGSRAGEWGKYKEFGALAALPKDPFLSPAVRSVVHEELHSRFGNFAPSGDLPLVLHHRNVGGYITSSKLQEATSLTPRVLARLAQHPGLATVHSSGSSLRSNAFPVFQVEPVARHLLDLMKEANVCTTLGLPPDGVRDLAWLDLIHDKKEGYAEVAVDVAGEPGGYYSWASVDRLVDVVAKGLKFDPEPEGYTTLWDAMLMFPAGRRPWLPVVLRILFEHVPAVLHADVADKPKVEGLFTSISVKGLEAMREEILAEHASARQYDIGNVSAVQTSLLLGCTNHYVLVDCAGEDLLERNPDKTFSYPSVLEFSRRFIFANEAAARSRIGVRQVVPFFADQGVEPRYRFGKGGTIYVREQVEPLLVMGA